MLPERAPRARTRSSEAARAILERAGYRRIETPTFEATELFARGVGESTDIVQKEMYTFDDGGGRSLTLRPEGTAPVCRAYLEHGMHKLAAAGEALVPVELLPLRARRRPGRYRQFWQVGAEAIGSDDPAVDAESILLLAELLDGARRARACGCGSSSLGTPETRARLPRASCRRYLRAHEDRAVATRCASGSTSTRCARSTPTTRARAR